MVRSKFSIYHCLLGISHTLYKGNFPVYLFRKFCEYISSGDNIFIIFNIICNINT